MIKLKPLLPITYATLKTLITGLPDTQDVSSDLTDPSWTFTLTAPSNLNLNPYAFPSNGLLLFSVRNNHQGSWHTATLNLTNNTPFIIYLRMLYGGSTVTAYPGATVAYSDTAYSNTEPAGIDVYFGNPQDAVQTYNVVSPLTI